MADRGKGKGNRKQLLIAVGVAFGALLLICRGLGSASSQSAVTDTAGAVARASDSIRPAGNLTSTPNFEPSATSSPTHSPTATNTATQTPQPATQTAVALFASQTSQAAFRTETRQAISASQTAKAQAATATRDALYAQRTQGAAATATNQAFLAQYKRVNIQDIVSYPGSYESQEIIVRAEIQDIQQDGTEVILWLYSWAGGGFTTAFMDIPLTPESGVRVGNTYNFYGTVAECPAFTFHALDGYCLEDAFIPVNK